MPIPGLDYSDEDLFKLLNIVLPAWVLLLVAPRIGVPLATISAVLMSALYVAAFAHTILSGGGLSGDLMAKMSTYQGVKELLATPSAVLPAWVHFVAFDLWVGRWEIVDARSRGVPQVLMVLPLLLTMAVGPTGLLLYLVLIRPWFRVQKPMAAGGTKQD